MRLDAISIGRDPPPEVNVVVEVPVGGEPIKYEMDKNAGTLVVDRVLYTAMRYPGNYAVIPHTLSDDGDVWPGGCRRAAPPRWPERWWMFASPPIGGEPGRMTGA